MAVAGRGPRRGPGWRREGDHLITGSAERALLERYLDELYAWNLRLNLTAVPREDAWDRHVGEALALLEAVPLAEGARLVDVGSGAGLPGVPLAVVRPDLGVVLCESDRRRAGFLTHVCGLLGLHGVRVAAVRAEDLGRSAEGRETFDAAISRATAAPAVLCELCLPLVRPGGGLAALVRDAAAAARACTGAAAACGGGEPWAAAPGVLVVPKLRPTPGLYPRRPGVPTRRPLA
jgi:16S rRNA (guanine527-N7)-methyltransferase